MFYLDNLEEVETIETTKDFYLVLVRGTWIGKIKYMYSIRSRLSGSIHNSDFIDNPDSTARSEWINFLHQKQKQFTEQLNKLKNENSKG